MGQCGITSSVISYIDYQKTKSVYTTTSVPKICVTFGYCTLRKRFSFNKIYLLAQSTIHPVLHTQCVLLVQLAQFYLMDLSFLAQLFERGHLFFFFLKKKRLNVTIITKLRYYFLFLDLVSILKIPSLFGQHQDSKNDYHGIF